MPASTVKQKFDEAAAKAEAENPDEPVEGDEPAEPDAPEAPEVSPDEAGEEAENEEQEAAEEAQARAGAELSEKAAKKLLDQGVRDFHDTLCAYFQVDDVALAQAPGIVGFAVPGFTEPKTHENFVRCQTCNGYGTVVTGSMKAGEETRPCPDGRCKGRGYWERMTTPPPPPAFVAPAAVTGPTVYEQPANGGGEFAEAPAWMGDPNITTPSAP